MGRAPKERVTPKWLVPTGSLRHLARRLVSWPAQESSARHPATAAVASALRRPGVQTAHSLLFGILIWRRQGLRCEQHEDPENDQSKPGIIRSHPWPSRPVRPSSLGDHQRGADHDQTGSDKHQDGRKIHYEPPYKEPPHMNNNGSCYPASWLRSITMDDVARVRFWQLHQR
jgi:hypothetical protein